MQPDCILMEIRMPGPNGVEAFREIKRLSPRSFVIFVTAYSDSTLVDEARAEGAVEVLPKPLDLERLLTLIWETAQRIAVLIVDDDPVVNDSLAEALKTKGCDVLQARSFDEGLALFGREPRRAVVLDMKLDHGHTGLEAIPVLHELNPNAVIVLVTGFPELVQEMKGSLEMSAVACLTKPFEVDELLQIILTLEPDRRRARG